MQKHILQPLLQESQQSPSPQERSWKPADPDVCPLPGPSDLQHPLFPSKSQQFISTVILANQCHPRLPHLQKPVLEKRNHLSPQPPSPWCLHPYTGGMGKLDIQCSSGQHHLTLHHGNSDLVHSFLLPPIALHPKDTHDPQHPNWCVSTIPCSSSNSPHLIDADMAWIRYIPPSLEYWMLGYQLKSPGEMTASWGPWPTGWIYPLMDA